VSVLVSTFFLSPCHLVTLLIYSMSNDIIQAQYDTLNDVAQRFGREAEANRQMLTAVRRALQPLQAGGWEGRGSAAFFAEMTGEVLPAVARLGAAL